MFYKYVIVTIYRCLTRFLSPNIDVNVTWFLQQLNEKNHANFFIDRAAKTCHTPRRNQPVDFAVSTFISWYFFSSSRGDRVALSSPWRLFLDSAFWIVFYLCRSRYNWSGSVDSYLRSTLFPVDHKHGLDLSSIKETDLFVPVVPLFESAKKGPSQEKLTDPVHGQTHGTGVIQLGLGGDYLGEQKRTIENRFKELSKVFPSDNKIVTAVEAKVAFLFLI